MRIIFLDIDGVLINRASYMPPLKASGARAAADPACVVALNRIIDETDSFIVVSSVWRFEGLMKVREYLARWGVRQRRVLDVTPRLTEPKSMIGQIVEVSAPRGREIQAWIAQYTDDREAPESFVILDDDADMEHLAPRLVQTKFEVGLTMPDAERAIAMLNPAHEEPKARTTSPEANTK